MKKISKKLLAMFLALAMCFATCIPAFADTTEQKVEAEASVSDLSIAEPNAISGYAVKNFSTIGSHTFYVTCSGWSLAGCATIYITSANSGSITTVDIFSGNSTNSLIGGPVMITGVASQRVYMANIGSAFGSSTFRVEVTNYQSPVSMSIHFRDRSEY